jgi:hypothetical protein
MGGHEVPNLTLMGFTLRLYWLWLARTNGDKTWSGYCFTSDRASKKYFDASVIVQVGDCARALFWLDR